MSLSDERDLIETLEAGREPVVEDPPPPPTKEPPLERVQLVTAARPFSFETTAVEVGRATIADLIRLAGIPPGTPLRVYVNGDLVFPEFYHVVRPKAGSHVLIRVVPGGGGGSGRGKNIGQTVLGLVLIVVGLVVGIGGYGTGWGIGVPLIVGGVGMMLSGRMNLVLPQGSPA